MFGFFKKQKKQEERHVSESHFRKFVDDLRMHLDSISIFNNNVNQKIDQLHQNHHELDYKHSDNVEVIKQWIDYFNKKHKDTDGKLQVLANYVKQLQDKIDKNKIANESFVKQIIDEYVDIPQIDRDRLKKEITMELEYVSDKSQNEKKTEVATKTQETTKGMLTNSEKWLLNILFNSTEPMTYDQIVARTGKSLNTIRVYMNSLKNKGSLVEETLLPNGSKVFAIPNKERVKKLYNINSF